MTSTPIPSWASEGKLASYLTEKRDHQNVVPITSHSASCIHNLFLTSSSNGKQGLFPCRTILSSSDSPFSWIFLPLGSFPPKIQNAFNTVSLLPAASLSATVLECYYTYCLHCLLYIHSKIHPTPATAMAKATKPLYTIRQRIYWSILILLELSAANDPADHTHLL